MGIAEKNLFIKQIKKRKSVFIGKDIFFVNKQN